MPTTIAASISVSRPCGAKRRCDMRLGGVLKVIIRVHIITGSPTTCGLLRCRPPPVSRGVPCRPAETLP